MSNKPWGGRFKAELDRLMQDFSESVSYDRRLVEADVAGSIAHARMLGETGIIKKKESERIIAGLGEVLAEIKSDSVELDPALEDIHMNVEARLTEKIGPLAGKLHTARSRNDQIALDTRIYFRDETDRVRALLKDLCLAIAEQSSKNLKYKTRNGNKLTVMPGFTHTRKAQPILFSHHLMAYAWMFLRDRERFGDLRKRMNLSPLGAGAFAGTTFPINREMTAKELKFKGVTQNSIDTVSDRDYLIEFAAAASITMVHLSRLMEEFIWWGLPEIGFVDLPESFCTGSSMMPNKMNPDAAELVRGKTGRVTGTLVSMLTLMKGTPLSYNRDFQEDKEGMFDAADTLTACLMVAERLVSGMKTNPLNMERAVHTGFILATEVADYLASKGVPFRDAHEVSGKMVRYCEDKHKTLSELSMKELKKFSSHFNAKEKDRWASVEKAVTRRSAPGGTAPARVKEQIKDLKKSLGVKK